MVAEALVPVPRRPAMTAGQPTEFGHPEVTEGLAHRVHTDHYLRYGRMLINYRELSFLKIIRTYISTGGTVVSYRFIMGNGAYCTHENPSPVQDRNFSKKNSVLVS